MSTIPEDIPRSQWSPESSLGHRNIAHFNHPGLSRYTTTMSAYSGYLSNLLTTTTSKYSQLRQKLTASEADGETEEDSHISRVLRAYYTEKGGRWPEWLGPDPSQKAPAVVVQSSSTYGQQQPQQGGGFVSSSGPLGQTGGSTRWGKGALSDLWDSGGQQSPAQDTGSLRSRPGAGRTMSPAPGPERNLGASRPPPAAAQQSSYLSAPQARPLPSQRQGSYQTQNQQRLAGAGSDGAQLSQTLSSSGGTASDRLKQRLWGTASSAGRSSPTPSSGPQQGYFNDQQQQSNPYDRGGSDGGRLKPVVSANSPWSSSGNANPYATGGRNDAYSPGGSTPANGAYGNGPYTGRGASNYGNPPGGPRPQR